MHEILIYGLPQDEPPLVGEVEHVGLVSLPPLFPLVFLYVSVVFLAIHVFVLPCNYTCAVFVNAHVKFHAILVINFINLSIYPVYFLLLIGIIGGLWAIVGKPSKLGGIKEGAYGDSVAVGAVVLVFQLADVVTKPLNHLNDEISAMVLNKIVIPCNDEDIYRINVV